MSNEDEDLKELLKKAGMPSDRELIKGGVLFGLFVFALFMAVYFASLGLPK